MKNVYKSENVHRVVLKLSGEVLSGKKNVTYDEAIIDSLTDAIITVYKQNYELGIVLGGGNIFRVSIRCLGMSFGYCRMCI